MTDRVILVPPETEVPQGLDHASFRLRPLGPEHNDRDYAAWTSSMEHLLATPGIQGWGWPHDMTLEENLADLEMHARHFRDGHGFTFTVLTPAGPLEDADVIGCVYLYPDTETDAVVRVRSWVRADRAELDALLAQTVRAWLETDWSWAPHEIHDDPRGAA